ncbi:MAG: AMP-binding protein [Clostridia bacterium]|nr:AMP-binding protein [Clostridia bacterium]
MDLVYKKYVNEVVDEKGMLKDITFTIPADFNFGFHVVDEIARRTPDKRAMIWLSKDKEERVFTFGDISRYSNKVANYFRSLGIKKGDKVMLVLKRHYEFWFCIVALHKLGAVVIPATHQLMKKDFVYRFTAAHVKGVVCTPMDGVCDEVDAACDEYDGLLFKAVVKTDREGWKNFDQGMEACSDVFDPGPDRPMADEDMLMYFTSGTTGYPKIATHSHKYAIGHIVTAVWWHNVDPNGLHFAISDTGWGKAAWGKLYGQWFSEACIFTYDFDRFHAEDILPLFAKYHITTFCAPPTMYRFFIKEDLKKYDLSSLQYCNIAGEALNPEVFRRWKDFTGLKMMEGFGQTETTLVVANLRGMEPKPGSMGKPNPQFDVDIVNEEGNPCAPGVTGEIVIRYDRREQVGLFKGYYGSEDLTQEAKHDGLYHTGDTAYRDEDGYYWYVGRKDDVIKSSGYRIGPFEIESVIMEHPKVLEVAVTGVPDPVRGFVVKATIVLVKGEKGSDELAKEIQNFVKHHTAPYKYPRVIEFVDELPKTVSGKIQRAKIRGQIK